MRLVRPLRRQISPRSRRSFAESATESTGCGRWCMRLSRVSCSGTSSMSTRSPNVELCQQCGHPWDDHLLKGYGDPPTDGWMECPVEGCQCRMTWSVDDQLRQEIDTRRRADNCTAKKE